MHLLHATSFAERRGKMFSPRTSLFIQWHRMQLAHACNRGLIIGVQNKMKRIFSFNYAFQSSLHIRTVSLTFRISRQSLQNRDCPLICIQSGAFIMRQRNIFFTFFLNILYTTFKKKNCLRINAPLFITGDRAFPLSWHQIFGTNWSDAVPP